MGLAVGGPNISAALINNPADLELEPEVVVGGSVGRPQCSASLAKGDFIRIE
jgi:hypothetical protein